MPDQNDIDRVWDIIENNSTGMLTTQFAGGLRARPVDARPDRNAGAIYFVTDVRGHKDDEIAAKPDVCFVVVVPKDNVFLSITGRATVAGDPAKAREIWKQPRNRPSSSSRRRPPPPRSSALSRPRQKSSTSPPTTRRWFMVPGPIQPIRHTPITRPVMWQRA